MEAERVLNDLYKKINETGCEGRLPVAIFNHPVLLQMISRLFL